MPNIKRFPFFRQHTDYTCGPVTVMMVLRHFGLPVHRVALRGKLGTTEADGTPRANIVAFLRKKGLTVHTHAGATLAEVRAAVASGAPVIVNYREPEGEGHYAVITGVTASTVVLNDPWHGPGFRVPARSFVARWVGGRKNVSRNWMAVVTDGDRVPDAVTDACPERRRRRSRH